MIHKCKDSTNPDVAVEFYYKVNSIISVKEVLNY